MIAVIKTGGKQYCVSKGATIRIEKIVGSVGDEVTFDAVLLVGDPKTGKATLGNPIVKGATVKGKITKLGKSRTVRVVRYKSKTRQMSVRGHRQQFAEVEMTAVSA